MLDKIHILISIFATVVILILSVIQGVEPPVIASRLVFVIIIFYTVGLYIRSYLRKNVFVEKEEVEDIEDSIENDKDKNDKINS